MSTRALNPAPTLGAVALAQLRMVALLQRREFAILGAIAAGLIALAIWGYGKATVEFGNDGQEVLPIFLGVSFPLVFIGALWPLGVWRLDDPARRGYFWSLPVAQGPHTLVRVDAGWVLLMCVCVAVMALGLGITAPMAIRFEEVRISFAGAWVPFVITTLPYLLVSVFVVAFEHPIRFAAWVGAGMAGALLVSAMLDTNGVAELLGRVFGSLGIALGAPALVPLRAMRSEVSWVPHYLAWFGAGVVLLLVAAFRRRDAN